MGSIAEKVLRAVSSHLTVRIDLHLHTVIAGLAPPCAVSILVLSIVFAFLGMYTRCGGFSCPARVRLSLLLCVESIQCPCGLWGSCGDRGVPVTVLTLVGGSRTPVDFGTLTLAGGFPEISSSFWFSLTVVWMAATFGIFQVSSETWRKIRELRLSRGRRALGPVRAEHISNGSCRDCRATRGYSTVRLSRVSTTAEGPSIAALVFGTSCHLLCTPLRLWGCRRASSVNLSSASSA